MKKELDVVAALIKNNDKILLCQRKADDTFALLWEFPGGVVEKNETLKDALTREIKEELDLEIEANTLVEKFHDENESLRITVYFFDCAVKKGLPKAKDCNNLGFFSYKQAEGLALAPVDRKILASLQSLP